MFSVYYLFNHTYPLWFVSVCLEQEIMKWFLQCTVHVFDEFGLDTPLGKIRS